MKTTILLTTTAGRIARIEHALRGGRLLSFEELRQRVNGVSAATLKRDLHAMRFELGMRIHYNVSENAYCMTHSGTTLAQVLVGQLAL